MRVGINVEKKNIGRFFHSRLVGQASGELLLPVLHFLLLLSRWESVIQAACREQGVKVRWIVPSSPHFRRGERGSKVIVSLGLARGRSAVTTTTSRHISSPYVKNNESHV